MGQCMWHSPIYTGKSGRGKTQSVTTLKVSSRPDDGMDFCFSSRSSPRSDSPPRHLGLSFSFSLLTLTLNNSLSLPGFAHGWQCHLSFGFPDFRCIVLSIFNFYFFPIYLIGKWI
ncbi:hypothetical protein BDV39DRAFT_146492 [Aspergillus sergii]|uniref:Uncharacterized protein n=1 Tax=Aspergillus sergii TaxID=1034303 RepID=A0A5N6WPQ9_9EURO|nr:hypothetical protein BDV39DRAFT_146492 [Aspergillus sergii]